MKKSKKPRLLITGVGITSPVGQGKEAFTSGLMEARNAFHIMKRPGRQKDTAFIGAELSELTGTEGLSRRLHRAASFTGQVGMLTLLEAWKEAQLDQVDPERIGLIIGGSNTQQRELLQYYEKYGEQIGFLRPTYALSFMDSDLCGLCTQQFGIKGPAYTIGGASASGLVAILKAAELVESGQVDVCIAMGAMMDLSYMECQGFRALGAMGSDRFAHAPSEACRPFDQNRNGFIYGENCGVVVIEREGLRAEKQQDELKVNPYGAIRGWAMGGDANRNPNPSYEGEVAAIQGALKKAQLQPEEIDYINPHGTGSTIGDETELRALSDCHLAHAYINGTKSITGHGLSAAGAVEVIATLLQMKISKLHPTRNLVEPMADTFKWVQSKPVDHRIENAISLSMGFGGVNTAICLQRYEP